MHLQISTNAHQVEPETRLLRSLFEHIAALDAELANHAASLEATYEKEIDHLHGKLAERDAEVAELRAIITGQVAQIAHLTEQRTTLRKANGELTQLLAEERTAIAVKAPALVIDAAEAEG